MKSELTIVIPILASSKSPIRILNCINEISSPIEVIIVIDGDNLVEVEQTKHQFSKFKRSGIRIFSDNFRSPGLARNFGLMKSVTNQVMFCDADDIPKITEIQKLIERHKDENYDVIIADFCLIDSVTHDKHKSVMKVLSFQTLYTLGLWRMIFKRDFISAIQFPHLKMGEDQVFFAKILNSKPRIKFDKSCVYNYYINNKDQATKNLINRKDSFLCAEYLEKEYSKSRNIKIGLLLARQINSSLVLMFDNQLRSKELLMDNLKLLLRYPHLSLVSATISFIGKLLKKYIEIKKKLLIGINRGKNAK